MEKPSKPTCLFAGFGPLALHCLPVLEKHGYQIKHVLTHSTENTGEKSLMTHCLEQGIPHSLHDLRKKQLPEEELRANLLVSVNYRYILPGFVLSYFDKKLNLHGSLLPKYRGRTPHVWAIINGETTTGVTCHVMDDRVDYGDIVHQTEILISPGHTGADIIHEFEKIYPECLDAALKKMASGFIPVPQDHSMATYFGKRTPDMGHIDFTKTPRAIVNFIRAQAHPYPGAYCFLSNGRRLTVNKAEEYMGDRSSIPPLGLIRQYNGDFLAGCEAGAIIFSDFHLEN